MADVQSNIQVSIDTTQALASIKNLQRQISAFHTSMAKSGAAANAVSAQMQQTLINSINATGQFAASIRTIKTTTESFTSALEKNKFSLGEYFRYAGGASKTFGRLFKTEFDTINKVARENVKDLQTQYIKLGRDASGAMKAIAVRPLSLDMSDLATRTMIASEKQAILNQLLKQGSTNLLNFGKNTQWAGRQLMVGFTLPLVALGSAASKTFMEMETQAIRFKKVYGDLFTPTAESQQALKDIQELGKEFTKYGIAVSETVGLAAEAAAAGFKGVDLQRQTAAATKLSILGQVESQKALETTIALQNAFSMSSANLAESIDFLNAVENQTVLSLDDMSTAIPKAAPVIQQLGGDVKDLAFFMTAMKEGGINASEGANALKSGLASIINPTGKAAAMLESFGINVKKIVIDNKGNLKKTVIDFATALNELDPLNRAQAIEQMFGKFQFARLSTLFANVTKEGTQAARVLDLAGSSVQQLASLSEKELGMTSESAMNKFKAAVENLKLSLVPLGEEFLKAVTPIAEFITKILDKFNNLSDNTKKIIVTITAVVAGLGPVFLMTFGLLANGLANIIKGFTSLKSLFNRTGRSTATLGTEVMYMTTEQRNAAAVAASLDQIHKNLAQTFTSEASAVNALTQAYQRAIAAQSQFVPVAPPITRGPIKKFASGKPAIVGGTGNKDSELALLMPGETVIPTAMSKKYGGLINAMIADKIPGYEFGKPKSGTTGLYGGQERMLGPYTMFAPGNLPGGFGMDPSFLFSDDFSRSLANTASAAAAVEGKIRLTDASMDELSRVAGPYADEITEQLRIASQELTDAGGSATHISQLFDKKKKEIETILSRMSASGSRGAAMARGIQVFAYPTDEDIRTGGNVRVPGVDVDSEGRVVRAAPRSDRRGRAARFQSAIARFTKRNPLSTQERVTRAHVIPEERVLAGGIRPLGGGVLSLPEDKQAAARAELEKRHIKLSKALGVTDIKAYDSGVKSVKVKDPYEQSRDRSSPHRLSAKDGRDDARSYADARDKELRRQSGRARRVATRAQGPAPIGATPPPGATILPVVSGGTGTPPNPNTPPNNQSMTRGQILAARAKGLGGRLTGLGGGMGILGLNMGLSMLPDFAGKGVAQGALTGANLGMMFGGYGMAAGAAIGLVTSAVGALIEKQRQLKAMSEAAFKSSADVATFFGNKVVDTTIKVGSLSYSLLGTKTASDGLGKSFGYTNEELSRFAALVQSLPEDNPLKQIIAGLTNEDNPEKINRIAKAFVRTQVAIGQIEPDQAQKTLDLILSLSNHLAMVGSSFIGFQSQTQAISTTLNAAAYSSKILGTNLLELAGAAANSTSLAEMMIIIDGIAASSISAAQAISAMRGAFLAVGNTEGARSLDALQRIPGIQKDQLTYLLVAATRGFKENITKDTDIAGIMKRAEEFNKNYFKQVSNNNVVQTKAYKDAEAAAAGNKKQIDLLKKKKKIIDDEIKQQEKIADEIKRQNDYLDKQRELDKEIVNAKIRGDYIGAAGMLQEKSQNFAEFKKEEEKSKLQAKSDALQEQIDALQLKNDEVVSAINQSASTQAAATNSAADRIIAALPGGGFSYDQPKDQGSQATTKNAPKVLDKPGGKTVAQTTVDPVTGERKLLKEGIFETRLARFKNNGRTLKAGDIVQVGPDGDIIAVQTDNPLKPKKAGTIEIVSINKDKGTAQFRVHAASGGSIRGAGTATSDSIPAMLSNGEYVIKADSVKKYGVGTFDALNAQKFKDGGRARLPGSHVSSSNINRTFVTPTQIDEMISQRGMDLNKFKNNVKDLPLNVTPQLLSRIMGQKAKPGSLTQYQQMAIRAMKGSGRSQDFMLSNLNSATAMRMPNWNLPGKYAQLAGDMAASGRTKDFIREKLGLSASTFVPGRFADGGQVKKDGWLQRWAKSISGQPGAEMFGTAPLLRMLAGLGVKKNILGASQVPLSFAGAGIGQKILGNLGKSAFYLPNKINQFRNQSRVNKMIKSGMWHGSQPTGLHGEDYLQGTNILEGAEAYDPFYGMGFFGTSSKAEANLYASGLNSFSNWGESFGSLNRIVGAPRGKYVDFTRGSKSLKWQDYGLAKALGVKKNRSMSNFMPENLGDIMSAQGITGGIMNRINAGRTSEDIQKALWLAWSRPAGVITKEGFAEGGLVSKTNSIFDNIIKYASPMGGVGAGIDMGLNLLSRLDSYRKNKNIGKWVKTSGDGAEWMEKATVNPKAETIYVYDMANRFDAKDRGPIVNQALEYLTGQTGVKFKRATFGMRNDPKVVKLDWNSLSRDTENINTAGESVPGSRLVTLRSPRALNLGSLGRQGGKNIVAHEILHALNIGDYSYSSDGITAKEDSSFLGHAKNPFNLMFPYSTGIPSFISKSDTESLRYLADYYNYEDKPIKKAMGGLIKGPGTGSSDSIKATLGYAGGGSIRVSNGEYIVKASSVRDYGVNAMNAINNGTATIGTNSGGTVYNINMPVTSNNANAEGVANEVIRKLKLEVSKNNKSNKVGL